MTLRPFVTIVFVIGVLFPEWLLSPWMFSKPSRPRPGPRLIGRRFQKAVTCPSSRPLNNAVPAETSGIGHCPGIHSDNYYGEGITHREGCRLAPSVPVSRVALYVGDGDVNQIPPGIYHCQPKQHQPAQVKTEDVREPLATEAYEQNWIAEAPAVIVIGGIYTRTTGKYGRCGRRYVHIEVGHVAQTIYRQAESTGLGTTTVDAFDGDWVRKLLNRPESTQCLAIMPTGHPAHE